MSVSLIKENDEFLFCESLSYNSVLLPQIRNELEQHMSCNLKEYKEFIDNEMFLILGQMDKATLIFDHVYLVSWFDLKYFFACSGIKLYQKRRKLLFYLYLIKHSSSNCEVKHSSLF